MHKPKPKTELHVHAYGQDTKDVVRELIERIERVVAQNHQHDLEVNKQPYQP